MLAHAIEPDEQAFRRGRVRRALELLSALIEAAPLTVPLSPDGAAALLAILAEALA